MDSIFKSIIHNKTLNALRKKNEVRYVLKSVNKKLIFFFFLLFGMMGSNKDWLVQVLGCFFFQAMETTGLQEKGKDFLVLFH